VVWLQGLSAKGIDVTLLSDEHPGEDGVPIRKVVHLWPLATMHALDVELQLRTAHAVVPFGHRAELLHRLLPHTLRPSIDGVSAGVDPDTALQAIRAV
jgi:hypothetical protein